MIRSLLPGLDLSVIAQTLHGGHPGERHRRLLEGQVGRLLDQHVLGHGHALRETVAAARERVLEDLVTRLEAADVATDRLDLAAMSVPMTGNFGLRSPICRRAIRVALSMCQSAG